MNITQIIIGVILVAALVYAWYTERTRRREAELKADIATRRTTLDGIQKQLDENAEKFKKAQQELLGADIPAHMLDLVGKPAPVGGGGFLVTDANSGRQHLVAPNPARGTVQPGPDLDPKE